MTVNLKKHIKFATVLSAKKHIDVISLVEIDQSMTNLLGIWGKMSRMADSINTRRACGKVVIKKCIENAGFVLFCFMFVISLVPSFGEILYSPSLAFILTISLVFFCPALCFCKRKRIWRIGLSLPLWRTILLEKEAAQKRSITSITDIKTSRYGRILKLWGESATKVMTTRYLTNESISYCTWR